MTPDLILTEARILTMDPARPRAEALAIAGDRILALGRSDEVRALAGPGTRVIGAGGRTLLPGFVESHMHLFTGAGEIDQLSVVEITGTEALAAALRARAETAAEGAMIVANGARPAMLGERTPITRALLDRILPDRPLLLLASDHHTAWANTPALRAAGLLHGAATPPGSEVCLGTDGLATGELREFPAFGPVLKLAGLDRSWLGLETGGEPVPAPRPSERAGDRALLARGLAHCAAHGITSIVNMDGNRYTLELLREIEAEGGLAQRVRVPFHFKPGMEIAALDRAVAMDRDHRGDWLASGFVKLFMDGVIDSGTAFMLQDYPDQPGWRGEALFGQDEFAAIAIEADRRGLQIAVHAIGDGAVRRVIDGYAAARAANGPRDARHRIEHIELIAPGDVPRLGALGIIASIQPPHPPGAMDFPREPTLSRIGRARWPDAYRCASLAAAGARLAFASDWPVSDVNPLRGIAAALTRQPWEPGMADERLPLMEVLAAYTRGGAVAEHTEGRKGMLRAGMLADLVLLDGDIEAATPEAIGAMGVAMTVCGGRVTWHAERFG